MAARANPVNADMFAEDTRTVASRSSAMWAVERFSSPAGEAALMPSRVHIATAWLIQLTEDRTWSQTSN